MAEQQQTQQTVVWQAAPASRIGAIGICLVLLILSVRVLSVYGYLATIGVLLVLAVIAQTYWTLLRPKLTAGPDGVVVVNGRTPERLAWKDIRRVEPRRTAFAIIASDGREVLSRYPAQVKAAADEPTEADAAAAFLAQRAAWERQPNGPAPQYTYTPPAKPARNKPATKE